MKVWTVLLEEHSEDTGELLNVEIVLYDNEQTARQHAERDGGRVSRGDVRSKLREY